MIKTEGVNPQTCYNAMAIVESFSLKGLEGFLRCKARLPNGNLMVAGLEFFPGLSCCVLGQVTLLAQRAACKVNIRDTVRQPWDRADLDTSFLTLKRVKLNLKSKYI